MSKKPTAYKSVRGTSSIAILVGGYAGSGKSQFARCLAKETHWKVFDKDVLALQISEDLLRTLNRPLDDRESVAYRKHVRPLEYEALNNAVKESLSCGNSVISSAPYLEEFFDPQWVENIQIQNRSLGCSTLFVWVHCDLETMYQYLQGRKASRDTHKLENWDAYSSTLDLEKRPVAGFVEIDNSNNPDLVKQAKQLIKQLQKSRNDGGN